MSIEAGPAHDRCQRCGRTRPPKVGGPKFAMQLHYIYVFSILLAHSQCTCIQSQQPRKIRQPSLLVQVSSFLFVACRFLLLDASHAVSFPLLRNNATPTASPPTLLASSSPRLDSLRGSASSDLVAPIKIAQPQAREVKIDSTSTLLPDRLHPARILRLGKVRTNLYP
jgi:hypothetical protein